MKLVGAQIYQNMIRLKKIQEGKKFAKFCYNDAHGFMSLMGDSPGIHPPFIMESGFENRETSEPNRLYHDIDEESYDDWLEGGHDQQTFYLGFTIHKPFN